MIICIFCLCPDFYVLFPEFYNGIHLGLCWFLNVSLKIAIKGQISVENIRTFFASQNEDPGHFSSFRNSGLVPAAEQDWGTHKSDSRLCLSNF